MAAVTGSKKDVIDVKLPMSWGKLTQRQLRDTFRLIAMNLDRDAIKSSAFILWAGLRVIASDTEKMRFLVETRDRKRFFITAVQIAEAAMSLEFLNDVPESPVRLERIGDYKAVDAGLNGFTLEEFIICDNLYAGYLKTKRDDLLLMMAEKLYRCRKSDKKKVKGLNHDKAMLLSVFYWWISLKDMFAREFPFLFSSADVETGDGNLLGDFRSERRKLRENADAMVRALTKGDVTKEKEVLQTDVWRAFAELNAQAKEYQEMKAKYKLS